VESVNAQLQTLFTDIGVSDEDRDEREKKLYAVIQEALDNHVQTVKKEKDDLIESCVELQKNVRRMLKALADIDLSIMMNMQLVKVVEHDLEAPYLATQRDLNSAHGQILKVYEERSKRASELLKQLSEVGEKVDGITISQGLEPPENEDDLDLTNSYLNRLEIEIQRWRNERKDRMSQASMMAAQIVSLWADLGTPQDQIDPNLMANYRTNPELLGTKVNDMERLKTLLQDLIDEKEKRTNRINALSKTISVLWGKLSEEDTYIDDFERMNRGLSLDVLEAFERENERLQKKKREHINVFIEDARETLHELWRQLYFSEDDINQFTPAFVDIYTDASLEAHEAEIVRLEKLIQERAPILNLIQAFQDLLDEEKQLNSSVQDTSRLLTRGSGSAKRDPTRLLREEKMRKRLSKRKPIVLKELKDALDEWESHTCNPFLINGQNFYDLYDSELIKAGLKKRSLYTPPAPTTLRPTTPPGMRSGRTVARPSTSHSVSRTPSPEKRPVSRCRSLAPSPTRSSGDNYQDQSSHSLRSMASRSPERASYRRNTSGDSSPPKLLSLNRPLSPNKATNLRYSNSTGSNNTIASSSRIDRSPARLDRSPSHLDRSPSRLDRSPSRLAYNNTSPVRAGSHDSGRPASPVRNNSVLSTGSMGSLKLGSPRLLPDTMRGIPSSASVVAAADFTSMRRGSPTHGNGARSHARSRSELGNYSSLALNSSANPVAPARLHEPMRLRSGSVSSGSSSSISDHYHHQSSGYHGVLREAPEIISSGNSTAMGVRRPSDLERSFTSLGNYGQPPDWSYETAKRLGSICSDDTSVSHSSAGTTIIRNGAAELLSSSGTEPTTPELPLKSGPLYRRGHRVSDFNWEKDAF
jgi:protein regulator of cytokinesis 1